MPERKSLASHGPAALFLATLSSFTSPVNAQSAPGADAGAARSSPAPTERFSLRARRLANGLNLVRAWSNAVEPSSVGLVLTVPLGARREASESLPGVIELASAPEPRCDRAGIAASTQSDGAYTEFVSRVPAAAVELALWREAQRLNALAPSVADPVRRLHSRGLDPRNAVLVLVTSASVADTLDALVDRTVAAIPSRDSQPLAMLAEPDAPSAWRTFGEGPEQRWSRQWLVVGARSPDHYAFELLAFALHDPRFGPLSRLLAERSIRGAVLSDAFVEHRAGRDHFRWTLGYATARGARPPLDSVADELLARLAREGILGTELRAARERWRVEWLSTQGSPEGLARTLARFEARWGNARLALTEQDRFDAVTVQDVLRVLNERMIAPRAASEAR